MPRPSKITTVASHDDTTPPSAAAAVPELVAEWSAANVSGAGPEFSPEFVAAAVSAAGADLVIDLGADPATLLILSESFSLRQRLHAIGDPLARRRELDVLVVAEIATFKNQEAAHKVRLGTLLQTRRDEFLPSQQALEDIEQINARLQQLAAQARQIEAHAKKDGTLASMSGMPALLRKGAV